MERLRDFEKAKNLKLPNSERTLVQVVRESYSLRHRIKGNTELGEILGEHLDMLKSNNSEVGTLTRNLEVLLEMERLGNSDTSLNEDLAVSSAGDWKEDMRESLSSFRENSKGKAFYRNLSRLSTHMNEGNNISQRESIQLFKAANSALTHLAVELEHNEDFQNTFNESSKILSRDLNELLGCISKQESPLVETLKSLGDFYELLTPKNESKEGEDE